MEANYCTGISLTQVVIDLLLNMENIDFRTFFFTVNFTTMISTEVKL